MQEPGWISTQHRLPPSGALVAVIYLDGRPMELRRFNLANPSDLASLAQVARWIAIPAPEAQPLDDPAARMREWDGLFEPD